MPPETTNSNMCPLEISWGQNLNAQHVVWRTFSTKSFSTYIRRRSLFGGPSPQATMCRQCWHVTSHILNHADLHNWIDMNWLYAYIDHWNHPNVDTVTTPHMDCFGSEWNMFCLLICPVWPPKTKISWMDSPRHHGTRQNGKPSRACELFHFHDCLKRKVTSCRFHSFMKLLCIQEGL